LWVAGCASPDGATAGGDLSVALSDLATRPSDSGPPGDAGGCSLGTADHCGTCNTVCPPGADDSATLRTCSGVTAFATCDIICRGESYDLDGKLANGCEAQDLPIQDSETTAVPITLPATHGPATGDLGGNGNPSNRLGQIYGDARMHESAPMLRPNGREDWWKLNVQGNGDSSKGVTACLGISNFPNDNVYEVCLSSQNAVVFANADCKQVMGMVGDMAGTSQCVSHPMSSSEAGTYYVKIRRVMGSNTRNQYALFIEN
jgi:hypothetical protein